MKYSVAERVAKIEKLVEMGVIKTPQQYLDLLNKNEILNTQFSIGTPLISIPKFCDHSWKHYKGFIEEYDFCEKCQEKK